MAPGSSVSEVKAIVVGYALEVGFDLVRVASAEEFTEDRSITLGRLQAGMMDGLPWYTEARVRRGTSPQELLPGARSIICLGVNYQQPDGPAAPPEVAAGKVARYARGPDYHKPMKKWMRAYMEGLSARLDTPIAARWYVDDGPMLDRAAARRAGLGWTGKNTNLLTSGLGSWVFLGQVITDLELEADPPLRKSCGACVRCIDSCPTGAIVTPYTIDNARCISYLTIENRGPIPAELRPQMQDWVFGCDICQDVCPVNRKSFPSDSNRRPGEGFVRAGLEYLDLVGLLEMSEEEFRRRFQGTPLFRSKRAGLQRNACVALGNRRDPAAVPALCRALVNGETLVRGHAAWALGRIGTAEARQALDRARLLETDHQVLEEISGARGVPEHAEPSSGHHC